MPNFASVTVIGHMGRDPETKYTANGDAVTEFSIATSRKRKSGDTTTWWRCACWGKRGEAIRQHLGKGDPILVTGEPFVRDWTDSNNNPRQSLEIDVRDWTFVGSKGERSERPAQTATQPIGGAPFDDDIPFGAYLAGMEHLA